MRLRPQNSSPVQSKHKKGSSTVLVILIMLALIVFGLITMMSANSSYKVSQRMANWTKEYFELESLATQGYKDRIGVLDEETKLYSFTVTKNDRTFEVSYKDDGEIVVFRERPQDFPIVELQFGTKR